MSKMVTVTDGETPITVCKKTQSLKTIDIVHAMLHCGREFQVYDCQEVGSGNSYSLSFKTPEDKDISFRMEISTANTANVSVYEGVTHNGGTTLTALNANRQSTYSSKVTNLARGATINTSNASSLISNYTIGYEYRRRFLIPGHLNGHREWILKRNKAYSIVVANTSGTDNPTCVICEWEEYDKPS